MLPVYVQQQPAGTVWYNDGVVTTERANRVVWHDRCTQAWVGAGVVTSGRGVVTSGRGTDCGF